LFGLAAEANMSVKAVSMIFTEKSAGQLKPAFFLRMLAAA
jgi:hypothetical protein